MSQGVLYLASGRSYVEEAVESARTLKRHNPSLPITLYTDERVEADPFDDIVTIDGSIESWGDSILSTEHFPYDKNLYLDADTYVCGDLSDVFDILDDHDLAVAHDIARGHYNAQIYEELEWDLPDSYPEYNCGVMAYNDNAAVRDMFDRWNEVYDAYEYGRNQPAFRFATFESDASLLTLPPEYNFMIHRVGYAYDEVKILHRGDSEADMAEVAKRLNSTREYRVMTWDDYPCRVVPNSYKSSRYELKRLMNEAADVRDENGTLVLTAETFRFLGRKIAGLF